MKGTSAYVGLLWLAAIKATVRMGDLLLENGISQVEGLKIDKVQKNILTGWRPGRKKFKNSGMKKKAISH